MIAIVTESLSCMNLADCAAFGVSLAPLDCVVGNRIARDRIMTEEEPLPPGEGYTAPPTELEYRTRFSVLLRDYDGVLCITASRKFSDSHRNALRAAVSLGGRVTVIDSGSVAGGLFLLVLRARHLVTLGYPMSRIKAELESYKNDLRVSFTAASEKALEGAKKISYRHPVGRSILSRHPVFRIEGGGIGVSAFSPDGMGMADELLRVLTPLPGSTRRAPSHVVIHYGTRTATVDYLVRRVQTLYPSATVYERPITLSLQINLGSQIIGVIGD